jgi:DNA-binding transcriptional regulator YhcF (GntR family)
MTEREASHVVAAEQEGFRVESTERMKVFLSKNAEVPLHDQLVEQIVLQIVTGQLAEGERLPSVRALAQRLRVHHNTISKAYASLVKTRWLSRRAGARLCVGKVSSYRESGLDGLIDQAIRQAQSLGFSIKELEARVIERLSLAAPRYVLVVDEEEGLKQIIKEEIGSASGLPVRTCAPQELAEHPEIAADAYLVAVESVLGQLDTKKLGVRSQASLIFCSAEEHLDTIRRLKDPSAIGVASYSPSVLKTARALLPAAIGEKHSYREFLLPMRGRMDFRAMDLVLCDSLAMKAINYPKKRHYRLVAPEFLSAAAEWFFEPRVVGKQVRTWRVARRQRVTGE